VAIESFSPSQYRVLKKIKKCIDYIPEDRVFKFNYKRMKGNARRQLDSYLRRIKFQGNMKRVYLFEINKLILNEALASIIKLLNYKF
jgi:hypothetical protein